LIASYCLTEPGAGSDASALRTKAVRDGDHYVLDGVKQFISGAGVSDVYVVMARTGGDGPRGISAFVVEKDTPGVSFGADESKMGWHAQPTAQVVFEGARVPADAMLGGVDGDGTGFAIAMNGLNGGRINIAACSLGGAQAAYDKTVAYLADRQAFGIALLDEPTIRFTLADMATSLEASRNLLWRAASALDEDHPNKVELCAMAKRYVTDNCYTMGNPQLAFAASNTIPPAVTGGTQQPRTTDYCHIALPWSHGTQVKFLLVYPLPLGLQASATYQNITGIPVSATNPVPNSQIAPSLGRNVGSCRGAAVCNANVNIDIIPPQSLYEDRLQQLDIRLAKIFKFGKTRVRGNFDIYNAMNGASILSENAGYGAKWLTPYEIMGGRLFKFSGQIEF